MIKDILLVGAGSFLGGIARYLVSLLMKGVSGAFPWATMTVNIAGCLLIGVLWAVFSRSTASSQLNLLLTVGFCGGFTTFSTFANESLSLYHGHVLSAALYIGGSVMLGILSAALGLHLGRML